MGAIETLKPTMKPAFNPALNAAVKPLKIRLLTHERELERPTNTGAIAMAAAGDVVERVVWRRKQPDPMLAGLVANGSAALVYPHAYSCGFSVSSESSEACGFTATSPDSAAYDVLILLDATWQEARKMFNRTAY
ncbi:DTW domain-containing protein, partial [Microbulbifer aestuariivivens]|uniref:DTW domain-containing protein n=1 Tax=Microbulbifer aestuariivivens TaxID=1908308 RepID=UPI0031E521A6